MLYINKRVQYIAHFKQNQNLPFKSLNYYFMQNFKQLTEQIKNARPIKRTRKTYQIDPLTDAHIKDLAKYLDLSYSRTLTLAVEVLKQHTAEQRRTELIEA